MIIITLSSAVSWLATLPGVSEPAIDLSITFLSWSYALRSDDDDDDDGGDGGDSGDGDDGDDGSDIDDDGDDDDGYIAHSNDNGGL